MLLLDYQNVLIQSLLTERFSGYPCCHACVVAGLIDYNFRAAPVSIDQVVSDFDGVTFHLSTPESKTKILISINVRCFKELVQYGAQEVLEREYGPYIVAPESGYDFSIQIDLENLPTDPGQSNRQGDDECQLRRQRRGTRGPSTKSGSVEAQCYGCTFRTGFRRFHSKAGGGVKVYSRVST